MTLLDRITSWHRRRVADEVLAGQAGLGTAGWTGDGKNCPGLILPIWRRQANEYYNR